jgi:hypothetical protein
VEFHAALPERVLQRAPEEVTIGGALWVTAEISSGELHFGVAPLARTGSLPMGGRHSDFGKRSEDPGFLLTFREENEGEVEQPGGVLLEQVGQRPEGGAAGRVAFPADKGMVRFLRSSMRA